MVFATWLTKLAHPGRLRADRRTMRMIFAYGIKSNTSTTSSFLNQRLDQLVISAFLSAHQLGIYVVAVTFTLFAPLLGGAIALAALPNVARLHDPVERNLLSRRMVSFTLIASAIVSLPIVIFAPQLITLLFGHNFAVGGNITRVTAIGSVSFATTRSLEAVLRGIGRPLAAGMAEFVALGATAVCLATLLPALGLIGAAWASLLAYSVSGAWMAWRIRKITGLPIRQLLTPDRKGVAEAVERFKSLRTRGRAAAGAGPRPEHAAEPNGRAAGILRELSQGVNDAEPFFGGPLVLDSLLGPGLAPTPPAALQPDPEPDTTRAATVDQPASPRNTLAQLILSDYDAAFPKTTESAGIRSLLFVPRALLNPSLRAALLARLRLASPPPDALWRRRLLSLRRRAVRLARGARRSGR
jgi:hypothetical protein